MMPIFNPMLVGETAPTVRLINKEGTASKNGSDLVLLSRMESKGVVPAGASIRLMTPLSNLGDATAADVAAGKTFTSAAGLEVTGTASLHPLTGTVTASSANTITLPADVLAMDHFVCFVSEMTMQRGEPVIMVDETMDGRSAFASMADFTFISCVNIKCTMTNGTISCADSASFPQGTVYRYVAWNGK